MTRPTARVMRGSLAAGLLLLGMASAHGDAVTRRAAAPDFVRPDLQGRPLQLGQLRGKVVLLSFWATWCEPCLADLPVFSRWQREYAAAGLQVVGVAMDDDQGAVQETARRHGVRYPVVVGDAALGQLYGGIYGLPQTLLIDRAGRIVARIKGEPDFAQLEQSVRDALKESLP